MNVKYFVCDERVVGLIRGITPAAYINKAFSNVRVDCHSAIFKSDYPNTNLAIFQRQSSQESLDAMRCFKYHNTRVVYDIDDDLFSIPEWHVGAFEQYKDPEVRERMQAFMREAHAVTVSTREMEEWARQWNPNVFILPNCLDFEDVWLPHSLKKTFSDFITIGYFGTITHVKDMEIILPALAHALKTYENVKVKLIGHVAREYPELEEYKERKVTKINEAAERVTLIPFVDYDTIPAVLSDVDIGLCPLQDVKFNRVKSIIKWCEMSAMRIPVIASNVIPYKHQLLGDSVLEDGVNIMLADDNWIELLTQLIEDEEKRILLGERAFHDCITNFDIRNKAHIYVKVWEHICRL